MHKPITTLSSILVALLAGHFGVKAAAAKPPANPATIFVPTSFWYTPLSADVPLHSNSANFAADFVRQKGVLRHRVH